MPHSRGHAVGPGHHPRRDLEPAHTSAALGDESELAFAGYAVFLDPPKASAMAAIHDLTGAGVAVRILTGDNERVTRHVCTELGLTVTGLITGTICGR